METDTSILHSDTTCPLYNEPVLPDEDGNCSLCGYEMDISVKFIIDNERKAGWDVGYQQGLKESKPVIWP